MKREASIVNRFDQWLRRSWPVDVWQIATAWTFYSSWLTHAAHPNWQASLAKTFSRDIFLDQLLAASGGRILWQHQVEAFISVATDEVRCANELTPQWARALTERSYQLANGRVAIFEAPDWPVVARIHAIFCETGAGYTTG